eukprot:GHVS01008002.1.p1 GENE.GHVS01008002.1~~GHVS01008002.1.p1  ORF type:complete len:274 (+),score=14.30 GHVS01008002.1:387-1208(+)
MNPYGAPQISPYGGPPMSLNGPAQMNPYGSPPISLYGAPPTSPDGVPPMNRYGAAPASPYGAAPASPYGAAPASPYGPPPMSAFGPPPMSAFGPPPMSAFGPPRTPYANGQSKPQPTVDQGQVDVLENQEKALEKQMDNQMNDADETQTDVDELKQAGSLRKPQGVIAFQGTPVASSALKSLTATGETAPAGKAPVGVGAPIIFLQPPPLTPSDDMEVDRCVECELQHMGEDESPAMKAAKEYELTKLGESNANSLKEVQSEIKETRSEMSKR